MSSSEVRYRRWVLLIACIGSMMAPLDSTIVSVSLPQIAQDLGMDYAEIIWVPTAYLVVLAVMILVMGRASDLYGRKPIFIAGFGIFTLGSLLCSLATSGNELILFRILQGFGAACFGATSIAIVTETFPSNERGKALGINAMAVYVGLSLGPPLGGLLTHALGWRSIFWVNVPIGILTMVLAFYKLKAVSPEAKKVRFDVPGLLLFSMTLVSLLVGLTMGEQLGWGSVEIVSLFAVAILGFVLFVYVESRKGESALLDPRLFTRNRLFAAANISAFLNYTSYFGVTFMISFYLQRVLGLSVLEAGAVLLIMPITMAILSPISGRFSDRLGSRALSSTGMFIIALGLAWLATLEVDSPLWRVEIGLLLLGIGMGIFSSPNTSAVMGSVDKRKLGIASGTLSTMRCAGQATSLAVMGAIIATVAGAGSLSGLFSGDPSSVLVGAEDFVEGMDVAFLVSTVIALLGGITSLARGKPVTNSDTSPST
ncbi:MAG: MFS transporter [Methanomassiliicoccales archaeon]|nr:MFS transporter [Methanomassiliicoccales archaeon]MDD1755992.1 MFS transporter [Methanomassiliicoccales archaeon]